MAIKRAYIDFANCPARWAHVRQPRRTGEHHGFQRRVEGGPGASTSAAVPDRDQLSSLGNIAAPLPLAPFFLGTLRGGPLAIHAPLIETHASNPGRAIRSQPQRNGNGSRERRPTAGLRF
jgi:hypothetical protein